MSSDSNEQVLSILESIKKGQNVNKTDVSDTNSDEGKTSQKKTIKEKKQDKLRGKPKSGRFWKSEKEKFSSLNKTKGLRQDFQKKTALRIELQRVKELAKQKQEELEQKELERKERRRQNIKRAEENKKKAEIVQVITNTAKLKRMRKKQLRFIRKRDTNKEVSSKE